MPQLDVSSFTSQIFWLVFTFFSFYFIIIKWILPRISKMLKVRLSFKLANSKDRLIINPRTNKTYVSRKMKSIIQSRTEKLEEMNKSLLRGKDSELAFYAENFIDLTDTVIVTVESSYIKKIMLDLKKKYKQ